MNRCLFVIIVTASLLTSSLTLPVLADTQNTQLLDNAVTGFAFCLDSNNNPHVAYTQGDPRDTQYLTYASWNGSAWNKQKIAQDSNIRDLALDSQNNPHILFVDNGENRSNNGLKYASWTGSNWSIQPVVVDGGSSSCLALDSSDVPHVAYLGSQEDQNLPNYGQPTLKYASWNGSSWSIQTIESTYKNTIFDYPLSLTLDSDGNAHIMFEEDIPNFSQAEFYHSIRYAVSDGQNWSIQTVFENASFGNMVLDNSGNPYFTYSNDDSPNVLRCAHWNGANWETQFVASTFSLGVPGTIALDSKGNPIIAFYDGSPLDDKVLVFAKWTETGWSFQTVDLPYILAGQVLMSLNSNDMPHVCYAGQNLLPYTDYLVYATISYSPPSLVPIIILIIGLSLVAAVMGSLYFLKKKKRKDGKHNPP
jgi:hypothetical protein